MKHTKVIENLVFAPVVKATKNIEFHTRVVALAHGLNINQLVNNQGAVSRE